MMRHPVAALLSIIFGAIGVVTLIVGVGVFFYAVPQTPAQYGYVLQNSGINIPKIVGSIFVGVGLIILAWGVIIGLLIRIAVNTSEPSRRNTGYDREATSRNSSALLS
jgi:hypothetical protein